MLQIIINKPMATNTKRWRIFGDWLKEKREAANLSQEGLGDLIGRDRQQIYRIEGALSGTKRETVIALAEALKINESEALQKAGFASQDTATDFDDKVRIAFQGAEKWTDEEKDKVLESVRLFVAGIRAEQAAESKK